MGKQPVWHKIIKASLAVVCGNKSQNIVQCQLRPYRVEFNSSWIHRWYYLSIWMGIIGSWLRIMGNFLWNNQWLMENDGQNFSILYNQDKPSSYLRHKMTLLTCSCTRHN